MKKGWIYFGISLLILSNFAFISPQTAQAAEVPAPVITDIVQIGQYTGKPMIKGTNAPGTEVLIYVDGTYIGTAVATDKNDDREIFSLQATEMLPTGKHAIMAIAKDKTSLVLSPPSPEIGIYIAPIAAPTLVSPADGAVIGSQRPLITGLTISGSNVYIYIDGNLARKIDNLTDSRGTADFAYQPLQPLAFGTHTVAVQAEDSYGRKSPLSASAEFRIEPPLPAPTVLNPVKSNGTVTIVGLTKNDTRVRVFVDDKMVGELAPSPDPSKTTDFSLKLEKNLTKGQHLVYTTAIDNRGKESIVSNKVSFTAADTGQPVITLAAAEDRQEPASPRITVEPVTEGTDEADRGEEAKPDADKATDEVVKGLLQDIASTTAESGAINENNAQQGKLQTNLVIFILFLLAVIAWIFWVNRELIKERGSTDEQAKK